MRARRAEPRTRGKENGRGRNAPHDGSALSLLARSDGGDTASLADLKRVCDEAREAQEHRTSALRALISLEHASMDRRQLLEASHEPTSQSQAAARISTVPWTTVSRAARAAASVRAEQ